ncbi:hypothetical protein ACFY93_12770 [Streptomyces sp. NPDC008313]|uniref:hypothetical protein n=1 Tax=Streptomyces sp. NPDC008313 TaxID=3364826 RepID=UPI0036E48FC6
MNVTRNVKPRDLADWPACRYLALFFWSWATLITFGPTLLMAVLSVAWMQPLTSVVPSAKVTVIQVGITSAVLTPLYFAPGINRLARSARFALLGPLAVTVILVVLLCLGPHVGATSLLP